MQTRIRQNTAFTYLFTALLVTLTLYFLLWLSLLATDTDQSYAASRVRDEEEYRFAQALTIVNDRKRLKGRYAFDYVGGANEQDRLFYHRLDPLPGLTFAFLAPNRWTHEIDAYEPSYLVESATNLLLAVEQDLARYGKRFSSVNVTLCPTTDKTDQFSELFIVSSLLPIESVKRRQKQLDSFSLSCRTILDPASCILQSVHSFANSYLVLLEDDLICDKHFLQLIWDVLYQLTDLRRSNSINVGAVILSVPNKDFSYSLYDSSSITQLLLISLSLTILILLPFLRRRHQISYFRHNFMFIGLTLVLSILLINLIGRPRWTNWILMLLHRKFILYTLGSLSASNTAAMLIPGPIASKLGEHLSGFNCSLLDDRKPFGLKSNIIFDYFRRQNYIIYATFPALLHHRGLYSIYKNDVHNPYTFD